MTPLYVRVTKISLHVRVSNVNQCLTSPTSKTERASNIVQKVKLSFVLFSTVHAVGAKGNQDSRLRLPCATQRCGNRHRVLNPVHTSNNVEATFDFVAFDNVASTLLLVCTGLYIPTYTHGNTERSTSNPCLTAMFVIITICKL